MRLRFFLDNLEINEPLNYPETEIELNWDKDSSKESVSINNWTFGVNDKRYGNDAVRIIQKRIDAGIIYEGIPYRIEIDNQKGKNYVIYNGFIDISKGKILCNEITAPSKEEGGIDWLNDMIDSFSYDYLYDIKYFNDSYYVPVPYVISKKANGFEIVTSIITLYILTQELAKQSLILSQLIVEAADPAVTVVAIIKLVLQIVYLATLLIAIVGLVFQLYKYLVQPVKYHNGMYVRDLLQIGFSYLGYTFSSSILQSGVFYNLLLIPEKYNLKEKNIGVFENIIGQLLPNKNEKRGHFKGLFGDLVRAIKIMFDAKIIIDGNVVYLEKQDFRLDSPSYIVPPIVDSGYTFNYDEFKANYLLSFLVDNEDRNTIQEYEGVKFQVQHSPVTVYNKKMLVLSGIEEKTIPFALAKRKTELTVVETIIDGIFNVIGDIIDTLVTLVNSITEKLNSAIKKVNEVIDKLDKIGVHLFDNDIPTIPTITSPDLQNLIDNRVGMIKMESDFINVPKLALIKSYSNEKNNKLLPEHEGCLNAKYLYENYHYFNNFVNTKGWNNQHIIREFEEIPFTFSDYEKVRINNAIQDSYGNSGELISLKFNPTKQTASGKYKIRKQYTNNLTIKSIYPDGN